MHSRRNKNKNRQNKVSHPCSSQSKPSVVIEDKIENIDQVEKNSELKYEERVPEIVSETVVHPPINVKETEDNVPKKPKRHRGKKKKQDKCDEILKKEQEKTPEVTVQTIKSEEKMKFIDDEDVLNSNFLDDVNVVPVARKKKNKNKVTAENLIEPPIIKEILQERLEEVNAKMLDEDKKVVQSPNTIDEQESKQTKNNKKKKHRHDSEKSDTSVEVISCTSAFHKLLDSKDENESQQRAVDVTKEKTEVLVEDASGMNVNFNIEQTQTKTELELLEKAKYEISPLGTHDNASGKNKERNEKDIKNLFSKGIQGVNFNEPVEETLTSLSTTISVKEKSINPLFETEKNERNLICEKPNDDSLLEVLGGDSPSVTLTTEFVVTEPPNIRNIEVQPDKQNEIEMKETQDFLEKSLQMKTKTVAIKLDDTVKQKKKVEKLDLEFVKAPEKGNKHKRKKSPKLLAVENDSSVNIKTEETARKYKSPELNIQKNVEIDSERASKSEDLTPLLPDYIEYPRSTSEQILDDNNNMVIQDVSAMHNITLEDIIIPDKIIIQGSGETPITSPEVDNKDKRDKVNVNKTDLKSKVIEVNNDMEELRLSFEKSLAELTAMEKSEQEIEKQYEEKINAKTVDIDKNTNIDSEEPKLLEASVSILQPELPICPTRREHKGKGKKKKGKQEETTESTSENISFTVKEIKTEDSKQRSDSSREKEKQQSNDFNEQKKEDKISTVEEPPKNEDNKQKSETSQEKGKQQCDVDKQKEEDEIISIIDESIKPDYEPIDDFEDALSSSVDDVNKTFEMIANETNHAIVSSFKTPEISVTEPIEDKEKMQEKTTPVSQPKNLLGHPDIPVSSNKTDYKKEKNKTPNTKHAKVKIRDVEQIEANCKSNRESKESQTDNKLKTSKYRVGKETTVSCINNDNAEYVYKYSFRKVFLHNACHVCKKELKRNRVSCTFCNLVFYCNQKHKDEDWAEHQALCFAVSTIVHLKDQKHIYEDAKDLSGYNYRLLRMQAIVSCEKILKRRLVPWEQEVLLYPRICSEVICREWKQSKLQDCEGCGQVSYCLEHPEHLSKAHQRWCKSYSLYQKLVCYQQTKGRLEPKMPSRVVTEEYQIPEKINEVLASMYQEKIDMNDMQYAALTQLATAPLTAAYCHQLYIDKINYTCANGVYKKSSFTLHVVGAELQFEADGLNKWEVFFMHLRPDVQELRVVLIGPDLNPSNLPLDLLSKIKLCDNCQQKNRKLTFDFQDRKAYLDFWSSDDFTPPDLVCTFNPSIERSTYHNGSDNWPSTINCILKLKIPFAVTAYTMTELNRDLVKIKEYAGVEFSVISEPKHNPFASVRPDRNFISDDEMPLLFKNYCFILICGEF